jgi:hypothetical protein
LIIIFSTTGRQALLRRSTSSATPCCQTRTQCRYWNRNVVGSFNILRNVFEAKNLLCPNTYLGHCNSNDVPSIFRELIEIRLLVCKDDGTMYSRLVSATKGSMLRTRASRLCIVYVKIKSDGPSLESRVLSES